jgi:hypothetical protein
MVLLPGVNVQQQVNGMVRHAESPAELTRRQDPGVAYIRTKPKPGDVSFAAIELDSLSGGFLVCSNAIFNASLDDNLND